MQCFQKFLLGLLVTVLGGLVVILLSNMFWPGVSESIGMPTIVESLPSHVGAGQAEMVAAPAPPPPVRRSGFLTDLKPLQSELVKFDSCVVLGTTYGHSIVCQGNYNSGCTVEFNIGGDKTLLETNFAFPDDHPTDIDGKRVPGKSVLQVYGDGVELTRVELGTADRPIPISLNVQGIYKLKFLINVNDQARTNWIWAQVHFLPVLTDPKAS